MAGLFSTYTVTVFNNLTNTPNNDLQLFLYEGAVELRGDVVYAYNSLTQATAVKTNNGIDVTAFVADAVTRPGEYDFTDIDFSQTPASALGLTLYSVVARPKLETTFLNGTIISSEICLSDPNLKNEVVEASGGEDTLLTNLTWAGGTVTYEQIPATTAGFEGTSNSNVYLKLTNLPDSITSQYVTESLYYPAYSSTGKKLITRFDVHFCGTPTVNTGALVWSGIPAYYSTTLGFYVIQVSTNQYLIKESYPIGLNLDLRTVAFTVNTNLQDITIFIRKYDTIPSRVISYVTPTAEQPILHTFYSSTQPIVGIGKWTYADAAHTPSYNLDVTGSVGMRYTYNSVSNFTVNPTTVILGSSSGTNLTITNSVLVGTTLTPNVKFMYVNDTITKLGNNLDTINTTHIDFRATELFVVRNNFTGIHINATYSRFGTDITGSNKAEVTVAAGSSSYVLLNGGYIGGEYGYTTYLKATNHTTIGRVSSPIPNSLSLSTLYYLDISSTASIFGYDLTNRYTHTFVSKVHMTEIILYIQSNSIQTRCATSYFISCSASASTDKIKLYADLTNTKLSYNTDVLTNPYLIASANLIKMEYNSVNSVSVSTTTIKSSINNDTIYTEHNSSAILLRNTHGGGYVRVTANAIDFINNVVTENAYVYRIAGLRAFSSGPYKNAEGAAYFYIPMTTTNGVAPGVTDLAFSGAMIINAVLNRLYINVGTSVTPSWKYVSLT